MPASNAFIVGLLDVIDSHINSLGGSNAAKLAMVDDICQIHGGNMSVNITQQRLWAAAEERWS